MIVIWQQEYDNCWIEAVISDDKLNEYIEYFKQKLVVKLKRNWPYAHIIDINKTAWSIDYQIDYGDTVVKMEWEGFNYTKKELDVIS